MFSSVSQTRFDGRQADGVELSRNLPCGAVPFVFVRDLSAMQSYSISSVLRGCLYRIKIHV